MYAFLSSPDRSNYIGKLACVVVFTFFCYSGKCQNVGIGTTTPTKARLEITGAVGGATVGIFGGANSGISLQQNWPTIGFNSYFNNGHRNMSNGYSAIQFFDPNTGYMAWEIHGNGQADAFTPSKKLAMVMTNNGNVGVGVFPTSPLSFPNQFGNKISLWNVGPNNDYGFGIASGTMRIYAESNIDLGVGNANSFTRAFNFSTPDGSIYSKQISGLNIVPLGIVSFRVKQGSGCNIDVANTTFVNIAGNVIISQTSGVPICGSAYDNLKMESDLNFNPNVVAPYTKIIAIGSPQANTGFPNLLRSIRGIVKGKTSYYITGSWDADDYADMDGTIMFYGMK